MFTIMAERSVIVKILKKTFFDKVSQQMAQQKAPPGNPAARENRACHRGEQLMPQQ